VKRFVPALLIVLLLTGCAPDVVGQVRVTRVIDGDTIEITGGIRVRYIGIDTPEAYPQPEHYGLEATARNRELVEGKLVELEKDVTNTDRYGRLLRYVYVDGFFVNAELVREGYARAYPHPPDTKFEALFCRLEEQAKEEGRGIWHRDSSPTPGEEALLRVREQCVAPRRFREQAVLIGLRACIIPKRVIA
jgi:micrococcal nuclease